jgi:PAS domain S-box-containing protein
MTERGPDLERVLEDELRDSELRFRGTFDNAAVGIAHVSPDGRWLRVNDKLCQIVGYPREVLLGLTFQDITYAEDLETDLELVRQVIGGEIATYSLEKRYVRGDSTLVWINLTVSLVRTSGGEPAYFISFIEDISGRKATERALRDTEREAERSRERARLFELSLDLMCIATLDGRFAQMNPAFATTLGYPVGELVGHVIVDHVHPEDRDATAAALAGITRAGAQLTNRYRCKDGRYRWLQWRLVLSADGVIYAVARDVTAERELMEKLAASLKEREVLLQEVHHRVKNNLQVISSLINMQARQLGNAVALDALEECRARVEAIALIHDKLYQTNDYASVPFGEYARGLVHSVFQTHRPVAGTVELVLDIDGQVVLPVGRAIPCGLILNELITNAIKHAFPGGKRGTIRVSLHRRGEALVLAVSDDGVGMPAAFDVRTSKSLGMHLVAMLVRQLKGQLEIARGVGASFRVTCLVDAPS